MGFGYKTNKKLKIQLEAAARKSLALTGKLARRLTRPEDWGREPRKTLQLENKFSTARKTRRHGYGTRDQKMEAEKAKDVPYRGLRQEPRISPPRVSTRWPKKNLTYKSFLP